MHVNAHSRLTDSLERELILREAEALRTDTLKQFGRAALVLSIKTAAAARGLVAHLRREAHAAKVDFAES